MPCQGLHAPCCQTAHAFRVSVVGPGRRSTGVRQLGRLTLLLSVKAASSPTGVLFVTEQETPQRETFDLLEWPEVCKQVVSFTQTTLAAEKLLNNLLPVGKSQVSTPQAPVDPKDTVFCKRSPGHPITISKSGVHTLYAKHFQTLLASKSAGHWPQT